MLPGPAGRRPARERGDGSNGADAVEVLRYKDLASYARRNSDVADACMREWTSGERNIAHTVRFDIRDVTAASAHVALVFLARKGGTDPLRRVVHRRVRPLLRVAAE